jgi:hypothetical protein
MGVSIDVYRNRIGTFCSSSKDSYASPSSSPTTTEPPSSWTRRIAIMVVFAISFITLFTVAVNQAGPPHGSTRPLTCPPAPACDPSAWPAYWLGEPEYSAFQQFNQESSSIIFIAANYFARSPRILDVNFNARYVNGNRRRNGIKMGHIKLGSGYWVNNMNHIETIMGGYKPHILGVSESSFKAQHDRNDALLEDYSTFFSKTLENENLNVSRVAVFTHKDLVVKERLDLMSDSFSSIWLEVGLPRQKKILVCNLYRDWQYLGQDSNESLATAAQLSTFLTSGKLQCRRIKRFMLWEIQILIF